jgi:hypothetical protein
MKSKLLCMALLCTAGCAGTMQAPPTMIHGEAPALAVQDEGGPPGIQGWIPGIFDDAWDILSINLGSGYGAGVHLQATNLLRVGIGEYADFGLLGLESDVFYGHWHCPLYLENEEGEEVYMSQVWDFGARFGVGIGGHVTVHTWQILDFVSSVIGFGYWSLDND